MVSPQDYVEKLHVRRIRRLDLVCELDGDDNSCVIGFPPTLQDQGTVVLLETISSEEHRPICRKKVSSMVLLHYNLLTKNVLGEDGPVAAEKSFPNL